MYFVMCCFVQRTYIIEKNKDYKNGVKSYFKNQKKKPTGMVNMVHSNLSVLVRNHIQFPCFAELSKIYLGYCMALVTCVTCQKFKINRAQ